LKALAKDPSGRWATAEEMSAALAKVPEVNVVVEARPAPTQTPTPTTRQIVIDRRALAIGAGVLGVLGLALGLMAMRHKAPLPATAPPPPVVVAAPAPPSGSAQRHLHQATAYAAQLWCSDALAELERALRDDERLRSDPSLLSSAIVCLRPKTRDRAIQFLVERVGAPARGALAAAATSDNVEVRRGAELALERLPR
jgi:hypothetical protein